MLFTSDVEDTLRHAAALVNTLPAHAPDGVDGLTTAAQLTDLMSLYTNTVRRGADADRELHRVRALRHQVERLWDAADDVEAVDLVNGMLRRGRALPQLRRHDGYGWHIHAGGDDDPLWSRLESEIAMAFVELLRQDAFARVKRCAADDCEAVLVDLSRNRSKQYCDTGNCGNRTNVRAYRARRATSAA